MTKAEIILEYKSQKQISNLIPSIMLQGIRVICYPALCAFLRMQQRPIPFIFVRKNVCTNLNLNTAKAIVHHFPKEKEMYKPSSSLWKNAEYWGRARRL
jgi:hypothetical protein